MIGVVVVSHGRLADEFVAATEHVVGPMDALLAVCIGPDDDMEQRRTDIRAAIADADRGEGVLILTDMFGGTPSNLAISLLEAGKVEVIAGVNLPMLIKLAEARSRADLDSLARMGEEAGKRYIAIASNVLEGANK
jgi:PTS system mannose-specific IIA component